MHYSIYTPAEDSFLISEFISKLIPGTLKKNPFAKFIEIGSGSGINLETALKSGIKKQNIFSCDINSKAVSHCKSLGFNCIKSDLFEKIPKTKFDIIIFNPPYLPEDKNYSEPKYSKVTTTGGKYGYEITKKFLKQSKNYLNKTGFILLIASSLAKKIDFSDFGYLSKELCEKRLFFEKLFLWKLTLK